MIAFTCFDAAFQTAYADLAERALTQSKLLLCSPGTIITQEKNGGSYLYWRVYDAEGQRRDHYIGSRDHVETAGKLAEITDMHCRRPVLRRGFSDAQKAGLCGG